MAQALQRPARPLFLGRVSCPPSRPVYSGERLRTASLHDALLRTPLMEGADEKPWLAELPAEVFTDPLHLQKRQDMRVWNTDTHGGSRYVQRIHLEAAGTGGGK